MSITKITTPELLDFPNESISSANTSGTVIPKGYTAACTFPDSVTNLALYTMDGNANDSCGSLNLTNTNNVPFVTSSPWGGSYQSADFDPSASPDEYLTIASGLGSVADRTRSLWIYLDAIPSVFATVLYIGPTGSPNQNYEVLSISSATTGHVRFQSRYSTGTDADIESLSALSTSTWYHVAWVYEGTSIYLYVNGVLQGSTTNTVTDTSSYPAFFGAWHSGNTEFDGKIAQARFYNTALTSGQIVDLYNENLTTYYRPTTSLNAGEFRYNEQLGYVEYYDGSNWNQIADEYITGQPTTCLCSYPTQGLALYEFQDNPNDSCGFYPGIPTDITYATGKYGQAAVFNGSSSKVSVNSVNQVFGAEDLAVSMWLLTDTMTAGTGSPHPWYAAFNQDDYGDPNGLGMSIWLRNYIIEIFIRDGVGGYAHMYSPATVGIGSWHHVVLTRQYGVKWELYLDGSLVDTDTTANILTANFQQSSTISYEGNNIGRSAYTSAVSDPYWWNGKIDQTRFYNSYLSAIQVSELYNEIVCN